MLRSNIWKSIKTLLTYILLLVETFQSISDLQSELSFHFLHQYSKVRSWSSWWEDLWYGWFHYLDLIQNCYICNQSEDIDYLQNIYKRVVIRWRHENGGDFVLKSKRRFYDFYFRHYCQCLCVASARKKELFSVKNSLVYLEAILHHH